MPQPRTPRTGQSTPSNVDNIKAAGDLLVNSRRAASRTDAFSEIGTTGLRQYGGFVLEEWLNQLQGRRAAWVWREMLDNDPTVGAIMFAIRWLARGAEWRIEEGKDPAAAEFVEECMHDMSHTWGDFISEALSMLPYGWSFHETVYKRRQGQQDPAPFVDGQDDGQSAATEEDDSNAASSEYKDGKLGWRKMPVRAQETLLNWKFSGYSGIAAMHQIDWHGGNHIIPIEKALLFRTQTTRNNPEGRSIFRNAYTSYFSLKNIKQIEAIGVERDLAGIPKITPPADIDLFSPAQAQLYSKVKQMISGIRRDEYEGLIMPSAGWEFELVTTGGSRQLDTDKIVRRYRQDIASSMLADFVLVGLDAVGSFAMVDVKSDLFGLAIDGILDLICEVFNQYAIPRLLKLNGIDPTDPPVLAHGSAGRLDLEKVGNFLFQLSGSGAPIPWSVPLLESLFAEAGLPTNFDEATEDPIPQAPKPEPDPNDPALQPVGPPKLTPGSEPFAREAHLGKPDEAAAAAAAKPATKPEAVKKAVGQDNRAYRQGIADQEARRPMLTGAEFAATHPGADGDDYPLYQAGYKADRDDLKLVPAAKAEQTTTRLGTAVDVSAKLRERHAVLSSHLEQEINAALGQLGEQAASSFRAIAHKSVGGSMLNRLVGRVVRSLNLPQWIDQHLKPILRNHAGRVTADTQRTIQAEIGLVVQIAEADAQKIADNAGTGLGLHDIQPQIRQSIMTAIRDGLAAGENPVKTADRIRSQVPAGRFVNAGARYRSRLIARNETADMQRKAAIAAYRSNPHITGVELVDGVYGPPRSDAECIGRNGETLPIADADDAQPNHPLCTLGVNPIVSGAIDVPEREPALAA